MADKFEEIMAELRLLKKEMELQRRREIEERTIFIKIHFEFYPISCEILGRMFSGVVVESIDRFGDGDQFHSRIRFPNRDLAVEAFKWFNGRCIYHGCCQLDLFLESTLRAHSSSNLGEDGVIEEMGGPNHGVAEDSVELPQSSDETKNEVPGDEIEEDSKVLQLKFHSPKVISSNLSSFEVAIIEVSSKKSKRMGEFCGIVEIEAQEIDDDPEDGRINCQMEFSLDVGERWCEVEALNQEVAPTLVRVVPKVESEIKFTDGTQFRPTCEEIHPDDSLSVNEVLVVDDSEVKIEEVPKEPGIESEFSKVNSYPPKAVVDELAWEEDELVDASIGIRWTDFRMNSSYCLNFPSAHQVFVKMSAKDVSLTDGASEHVNGFSKISRDCLKFFVAYKVFAEMPRRNVWIFDPGIVVFCVEHNFSYPVCFDPEGVIHEFSWNNIPFDRGKVVAAMMCFFQFVRMPDVCIGVTTNKTFVFDPGIPKWINCGLGFDV